MISDKHIDTKQTYVTIPTKSSLVLFTSFMIQNIIYTHNYTQTNTHKRR